MKRQHKKAKVSVENFDEVKKLFLMDIKNTISMDEMPPKIIVNCDHTAINCHLGPWRKWSLNVLKSLGKMIKDS